MVRQITSSLLKRIDAVASNRSRFLAAAEAKLDDDADVDTDMTRNRSLGVRAIVGIRSRLTDPNWLIGVATGILAVVAIGVVLGKHLPTPSVALTAPSGAQALESKTDAKGGNSLNGRPAAMAFGHSRVNIVTGAGIRRHFAVEVATSPAQRQRGLMFRHHLAANAGMVFIFRHSRPVIMWMKDTLIPLDMVFIGADGRIAGLARQAVPESLTHIPSPGPVQAVLEIQGGAAARLDLAVGDRVICPLCEFDKS